MTTSQRGFTLVELMMAVGIVGVLATMAIPDVQRTNLRSKTTERTVVVGAIHKGIEDLYRRNGTVTLAAAANPATPIMTKQAFSRTLPGWSQLLTSIDIEGPLYYSYSFAAWEASGATPAGAWILAEGDLDGDGVRSTKLLQYERREGMYVLVAETPAHGYEDATTF
jgi:prepilin-type N-terminal cleavage/methylation domain-containing protein